MKSQDLKKLDLPAAPGVYFWKKGGEILYIGKATNLRDRVRSYFANDLIDTRGPNILDMVTQTETVEYEETPSVIEALILESNLIKKYQPKYNVKEKDDKSFYQVIVTDEPWPRVILVRTRDLKIMEITGKLSRIKFEGKIKYCFGPFPHGTSLRDALKIIRKIFPFRDYRADNPENERFYKQLGLSPDTSNAEARKEYLKNINNIRLFFEGKKGKILKELERDMNAHAKALEFEQAEFSKRKMFALKHINDVALIKDEALEDRMHSGKVDFRIESYDIAHLSGRNTVGVMTVVTNGAVDKSQYRKFKIKSLGKNAVDDYASLQEILTRRFNHPEWKQPSLIVMDGGIGQYNAAAETLMKLQIAIPLVSVIKDERHRPKAFHGNEELVKKYKKDILLANSESHRFAITFHKNLRGKDFLAATPKNKR
ncbi:MAG: UvrABC system protein excinuclease subunit [Patescibacteria group bacterium]|nr:UvrABC system protein excinuclease subunit [Patescibacteria group bacterium]